MTRPILFNNSKDKNFNIFLDLDNTIICSEEYSDSIMKHVYNYADYDFIKPYVTVARPYLQEFLDYLFKYFNVCIWTAASKNYASFIYDRFINKMGSNRKLKLLLFNFHCDLSMECNGGSKCLSMLWDKWKIPGFNSNNTFIIDDLKEVYTVQPNNCFRIKAFKIKGGEGDIELLKMIQKLESIIKPHPS